MVFQPRCLETQKFEGVRSAPIFREYSCTIIVMRRSTTAIVRMSQAIKNDKVVLRKRIKAILNRVEPHEVEEQCSLTTSF